MLPELAYMHWHTVEVMAGECAAALDMQGSATPYWRLLAANLCMMFALWLCL
jgi:hypothetical protein